MPGAHNGKDFNGFKLPELEPSIACPVASCQNYKLYSKSALLEHLKVDHRVQVAKTAELRFVWSDYFEQKTNRGLENSVWGGESDDDDKRLRARLNEAKLQQILKMQQQQRLLKTQTAADCVFCRKPYESLKSLFKHMLVEHGFNVGNPDNMVNVPSFIASLKRQLGAACCPLCEVTFKSPGVLRQHMRKKKHFRLNSSNTFYDQFYIINYVDPTRSWVDYTQNNSASKVADAADSDAASENNDAEWADWVDDVEVISQKTTCLFDANHVLPTAADAIEHMKTEHGADLRAWKDQYSWDFYHLVKVINYIRQKHMIEAKCWQCDFPETVHCALSKHLKECNHATPSREFVTTGKWDDVQYLFPVYESDPFFFALDDL